MPRGGHQPGQGGATPGVGAQEPLVDLVAGEQEQEAEADVGEDLRLVRRTQVQALRPDQHAADQQENDLRDARPGQHGDENGCEHRDHRDREQRAERGMHVHSGTSP